jgi:protein-arginine kinase activator protein McsA
MAIEFTLNNSEEFQEMVERRDFSISKAVVETILNNLNTRKQHVHVITVICLEEGNEYDITLERKYFADTLQENLKYYVENEQYESCTKIVEAINYLKEKQNTPKKNGKNKTNISNKDVQPES